MAKSLQSVSIYEHDINGDFLMVWCFPSVPKALQEVVKLRSGFKSADSEDDCFSRPFRFSKFQSLWLYQLNAPVNNPKHPKVKAVSICVTAKTFNPSKHSTLLKLFMRLHQDDLNAVGVMEAYLAAVTRGKVEHRLGSFEEKKFDDRRACISPVKNIIEMFGPQTVYIWIAMLCKKRVFVYADSLGDLLPVIRSFPLFGSWHRMDWSVLRPFMTLSAAELADLRSAGVYVAGFTDANCASQTDLYDLFVDLSSRTFTIPEHAKGVFTLTKFHKDLATHFQQAAATQQDQAIIKSIALKTNELTANVKKLRTQHDDGVYITLKELQEKSLPPNMDSFLYNVAVAERMAK